MFIGCGNNDKTEPVTTASQATDDNTSEGNEDSDNADSDNGQNNSAADISSMDYETGKEYLGEGSFFCKNLRCIEFGDSVKEAEDGMIFYGDNITLRLKKDSYLANIGDKIWYREGHGVTVELY